VCARPPFALERLRIERYGEGSDERTAPSTHGEAGIHQVIRLGRDDAAAPGGTDSVCDGAP